MSDNDTKPEPAQFSLYPKKNPNDTVFSIVMSQPSGTPSVYETGPRKSS